MVVGEKGKTVNKTTELVKERMADGESILLAGHMKDIYIRLKDTAEYNGYRMVCLDPETSGHDSINLFKTMERNIYAHPGRTAGLRTSAADIFCCCLMADLFIGQQETEINETAYIMAHLACMHAMKTGMDVDGLYRFVMGNSADCIPGFLSVPETGTPPWRTEDDIKTVRERFLKKLPEKVRTMLSTDGYDIHGFGMEKTLCCVSGFKMVPFLADTILQTAGTGVQMYTAVMDETGCIMEPAERKTDTRSGTIMRLGTDDIPEAEALKQLCPTTYYNF